jgi:protein subunit release factor A
MEKIILEIRASEGGDDSKLLVQDLSNIYQKSCRANNFTITNIENRDGMTSL